MRKVLLTGLLCVSMAAFVTGCNTSQKSAEATTQSTEATGTQVEVDYTKGLNEDGTLSSVDYADYVTVADYSAIELAKADTEATDDDVQSQIDSLMANYETTEEVTDRASQEGDVVNIDYVGSVDGEAFDGGSDEGYDLTLGSGTFIDGFEDQLIGHKAGDKVSVEVTFPDDYSNTDLAGKEAVFETTVNSVSETVTPELTDDWVKENLESSYGYTSVEDMKAKIKESLDADDMSNAIWDYLLTNSTFKDIPEEAVKERIDVYLGGLSQQLSNYGATLDDYMSMYGYSSLDDLYDVYYDSAEQTLKMYLIADAIADKENLSVTDDDLKEYFGSDDYSTYIDSYSENYVNRTILNYVVEQFCKDNVTVK